MTIQEFSTNGSIGASENESLQPWGRDWKNDPPGNVISIPLAGKLSDFYARGANQDARNFNVAFELVLNGVSQGTAVLVSAAVENASNTVVSFDVSPGDVIAVVAVPGAGGGSYGAPIVNFLFTPDS